MLKIVPYNSGVRKLLGNFIAYLDGADTVIQMDDDNFILDGDFIGDHCLVGNEVEIELVQSENGWYNVYEPLKEENDIPFFPRGFPWSKRDYSKKYTIEKIKKKARVVLINGLVYEDPDVDAISRLFWPIRVKGIDPAFTPNYGLHPSTWCAFNNQNTSTSRELTQVYFTPAAGGRNSDIWASFIICKLVEQFNHIVAFGNPFVTQYRNPHDLWVDLDDELLSNKTTENFIAILRSVKLDKHTYSGSLKQLISGSLEMLSEAKDIPEDQTEIMTKYFNEYNTWINSFSK